MSDRYPRRPGFVAGSDTSEAAAESVAGSQETMKQAAYRWVNGSSSFGLTCSELEEGTGWTHQSASARLRELVLDSKIVDSGHRRPGRSGRQQRIYRTYVPRLDDPPAVSPPTLAAVLKRLRAECPAKTVHGRVGWMKALDAVEDGMK